MVIQALDSRHDTPGDSQPDGAGVRGLVPRPGFLKALGIFHCKAGIRIAVRSFAPLFASILALLMLDMNPVAAVAGLALATFAPHPAPASLLPLFALAFVFPAWAAPKLTFGLHGWIRHLACSGRSHRNGVGLALMVVQLPFTVALACLAFVAHSRGLGIGPACLRWLAVLAAGALASLPVKRRRLLVPACLFAAFISLVGGWSLSLVALALLAAAAAVAGPLIDRRSKRPWRPAHAFFSFRIAWRALGWRTATAYLVALLPLGVTALFISNNQPPPAYAAGAARMGGSLAVVLVMAGLAHHLGSRRPAWPLARSFPWSALRRVVEDTIFLILHALPLLVILAVRFPGAAAWVLILLPLPAIRSATAIRRIPGSRTATARCLAEGGFLAALVGLLPWTALVCLAAVPLALLAARESERSLPATGWADRHHSPAGDSLSWSRP
jgi:hypothetical protein